MKTLFLFLILLILPLHPLFAQKNLPMTMHVPGNSKIYPPFYIPENIEKQLQGMSIENRPWMRGEETVASSEDGRDMDNGTATGSGEDDTDADTDSDRDDDADRGNDALTPAEQ